ncbi:hypothetical protein MHBO_000816, partial [Bonamia ostreae]
MEEEFNISLKYLDPKFYAKEAKTGFLAQCKHSRRLENLSVQNDVLSSIKNSVTNNSQFNPHSLWNHDTFDPLYQLCSKFPSLEPSIKRSVLEILCDAIENLVATIDFLKNVESDEKTALRNAAKIVSFLGCMAINTSEKFDQSDKNKWNWHFEKERIFGAIKSVINCKNIKRLWNLNTPEEGFYLILIKSAICFIFRSRFCYFLFFKEYGNMFFKTATTIFEAKHSTNSLSSTVFKMFGLNIENNSYLQLTLSATFTHMLLNREKFAPKIAKLYIFLVEKYKFEDIIGNIIREIGRLDDKNLSKNIKGAENIGIFLSEIAVNAPKIVYKNVDVLLPFLSGSSYKMRNGVIEIFGELIINLEILFEENLEDSVVSENKENNKKAKLVNSKELVTDEDEEVKNDNKENLDKDRNLDKNLTDKEKIENVLEKVGKLLDRIEERTLDVVSYTRNKALQVLKKLV